MEINTLAPITPRFPPELQNKIFSLAARSDHTRKIAKVLILVSHDVHKWVVPILYESLFLVDTFSFTAEFITETVKNIFVAATSKASLDFLSQCTGIRTLIIADSVFTTISYDSIATLSPTQLSLDLGKVTQIPDSVPTFSLRLFSRVTHLEIYKFITDCSYHLLPCLTHLALHGALGLDNSWSEETSMNVEKALNECIQLKMVLALFKDTLTMELFREKARDILRSPLLRAGVSQREVEVWEDILDGITVWERAARDRYC